MTWNDPSALLIGTADAVGTPRVATGGKVRLELVSEFPEASFPSDTEDRFGVETGLGITELLEVVVKLDGKGNASKVVEDVVVV